MLSPEAPTPTIETNPDRAAEAKVDAIPQEQFDAFVAQRGPTHDWSPAHRIAAQTGVRVMHAIELGAGGRGAQSPKSRERRVEEKAKVGLEPGMFD